MSISKVELTKQLKGLGIKIIGGCIRKSDILKLFEAHAVSPKANKEEKRERGLAVGFLKRMIHSAALNVSAEQRQHAIHGVEGIAFYEIPPLDFIRLTTGRVADVSWFLKNCETTRQYNEWGSRIHPFLLVTPSGKIVGHEGRHRAAALHRDHPDSLFTIVIAADERAYSNDPRWGWRWKRQLPVPKVLHGEFNDVVRHGVDASRVEVINRKDKNGDWILG